MCVFFVARARCGYTRLPRHDCGPTPGENRSPAGCLAVYARSWDGHSTARRDRLQAECAVRLSSMGIFFHFHERCNTAWSTHVQQLEAAMRASGRSWWVLEPRMPTKPTIVAPKTGSKKRVETCRQRGTSTVQPLVACARGSRRIGSASNASGVKTKTTQNSRRLAIFFCPRSGGSRHKPERQQHFFANSPN